MKAILVEYDAGIPAEHLINYGLKMYDVVKAVDSANRRIANNLQIDRDVLSISNGRLKASGVAGIIRLSSNIEIEIKPKFLSGKKESEWRTTIYLLSALSKHGRILSNERIKSKASYSDSLYDMAGRILAEEYLTNKRKPIRKYRKEEFVDYSVDGELDIDSFIEINPNGFKQSRIRFDKENIYNATIKAAMQYVIPYVSDQKARNILDAAISEFGKQKYINTAKKSVPPRNKEWERAYTLSFDIMQGLGSAFDEGMFYAPGFIANTWQMWEWLITTALMIGANDRKVVSQKCVNWGMKYSNGRDFKVNMYPDVTVYSLYDEETPKYLVDAKYKLLSNDETGEIDRADLYEAYAFCNGLNTDKIFLVYPTHCEDSIEVGTAIKKSVYNINGVSVYVVMVSFGPIGEKGGIYSFSKRFVNTLEDLL